jgi:hypothetical protein
VPDAELRLQDPDHVPAAERADAIRGERPGVEARLEPGLLLGRELGRRAAGLAGHERLDPAAPVAARPLVHEAGRAAEAAGDLVPRQFVPGHEQDRSVAVALRGVALAGHATTEPFDVVGPMQGQLHRAQHADWGAIARI